MSVSKKNLSMKASVLIPMVALLSLPATGLAQQNGNDRVGSNWSRVLKPAAERDSLSDRTLHIRGDSGKWTEKPRLQHAPPIARKPAVLALDDWADQLPDQKVTTDSNDDNWLLFRTKQLDDNDRVWIDRIERKGNRFTVVTKQAIWQGRYRKNFTYHKLLAVNLGRLEPGRYQVRWTLVPMEFRQFERPGSPRNQWPKEVQPAEGEPEVLKLAFTVAESTR